jgi:hypothetical protein
LYKCNRKKRARSPEDLPTLFYLARRTISSGAGRAQERVAMAGVVSRASTAGLRGVTTPRTASRTRRVVVSSSARRDVPCAVGKKSSHHRARPLAVSWTAPRATSRRDRRFAKTRASVDDDDAKEDADKRPASEKRPASGDVRPESGDKKPPEPSPNDDETDSDANLLDLLNLLV